MPVQAADEGNSEQIERLISTATKSVSAVIGLQIIVQLLLKGAIDHTWAFFFIFQLMCNLDFYDVPFPFLAENITFELRKLVDFFYLNPENLIKIFKEDFTIAGYLGNV